MLLPVVTSWQSRHARGTHWPIWYSVWLMLPEVAPGHLIRVRGKRGPLRRARARPSEEEEDGRGRLGRGRRLADAAVREHAAVDARVVRDIRHPASLALVLRGLPGRAAVDRAEAAAAAVDVVGVRRVAAEELLRPGRLTDVVAVDVGGQRRAADTGDVRIGCRRARRLGSASAPCCSRTGRRRCRPRRRRCV